MRILWMSIGILALAQGVPCAVHAQPAQQVQQAQQFVPAAQLVREVVYNELNDHHDHGYWRYWIERHTPKETRLEDQVETAEGSVTRLALTNGSPLSAETRQEEQARIQHLLASSEQQASLRQEHEEDEQRIGRILALLPDAFLFEYAGEENGCHKLSFRPYPDYTAHSPGHMIEARIFHAMTGALWVDARYKRLVRLDARVEDNVDFGYGILGRLYKGGWVQLQRTQVSPADWKTEHLEVHMLGRALLVKNFARETSELRGGFAPVPAGMNLAQGMALLQQTEAQTQTQAHAQAHAQTQAQARGALATPAVLALRR